MGHHRIGIPRSTPTHSPRHAQRRIIRLDPIRINSQIRTRRIFLPQPTKGFVAGASSNDFGTTLTEESGPGCGKEGYEAGPDTETAEGAALVYFGFVEEDSGVGGETVENIRGGEAVDLRKKQDTK